MKEFKTTENLEEKIKVTSLEIIVTGTKDKPYFEIKYKELGKEDYNIGYSSYDLNNVFTWKEECFDIANELAEEYINCSTDISTKSTDCSTKVSEMPTGWIPCSSGVMPKVLQWVLIQTTQGDMDVIRYIGEEECWGNDFYHRIHPRMVVAWCELPAPYTEGE